MLQMTKLTNWTDGELELVYLHSVKKKKKVYHVAKKFGINNAD